VASHPREPAPAPPTVDSVAPIVVNLDPVFLTNNTQVPIECTKAAMPFWQLDDHLFLIECAHLEEMVIFIASNMIEQD
jgi:hypothetical protein